MATDFPNMNELAAERSAIRRSPLRRWYGDRPGDTPRERATRRAWHLASHAEDLCDEDEAACWRDIACAHGDVAAACGDVE